jgi:hypothetical protein
VIGSAHNVSPLRVVYDVATRCSPLSIKLVFITQCHDRDLWLRILALINSYLKLGHELVGLPADIIASRNASAPKTKIFYLEIAEALARRINEPIEVDPSKDPVRFKNEMEIRNRMLDALNQTIIAQSRELEAAARSR